MRKRSENYDYADLKEKRLLEKKSERHTDSDLTKNVERRRMVQE
jgi:hypothetical protein